MRSPTGNRHSLRGTLVAGLLLTLTQTPASIAQEPGTDITSPPLHQRLVQLLELSDAGESVGASYYTPTQDHREIDITALDFSRAWRIGRVLELQRRVGLFHAWGTRTDAPSDIDPDSTATGFTLGAAARLYPLEFMRLRRLHPFVEGSAQFLFTPGTPEGFPAGGSGVNGFERAGAGLLLVLGPRLAIEASYQWWAHVSNGSGLTPQNPMWNGRGGTLAVRLPF